MNSFLIKKRETLKSGIIISGLFGSLMAFALWRHKIILSGFFGVMCALGILFLLAPVRASRLYDAWLKCGYFIGRTVTLTVLTLAYYLVITPTAIIKSMINNRPLPLIPDRHASTYWITRIEPAQPKERFHKRY